MPKALAFAALLLLCAAGRPAKAELLVGLTTTNGLVRFDSAAPGTILGSAAVTGLESGEQLLAIDYRPANGLLYGLTGGSRLYTLNVLTGLATFSAVLSVPLTPGTSFGIDFNPVVDRLRVVHSDARIDPLSNQNLRVNVDTGDTIVDGNLIPVMVTSPLDPNIGAVAYSNNFVGAASTTLHHIDFFRDRLVIQNPANSGTLMRVGELAPTGMPPVGEDITNELVGFDISGTTGVAFASLTSPVTGLTSLHTINLATGAATLVGGIGAGMVIADIASPFGSPVPEPASMQLIGAAMVALGASRVLSRRRRNR